MNATKRAQVPFGLRKKLMAATSMLLVAAIMLVSTSYAWFTLSTAPEITGITTSVGANGNLEIALLTTETFNNTGAISSAVGDSMANTTDHTVVDANITWGNLIDLSDSSYGLGMLKLYPSKLNAEGGALKASPLALPVYGADGRVNTLDGDLTTTAIYNGTAFATAAGGGTDYGVRAVGSSSTLSPRQVIFQSAKAGLTQSANSAQEATRSAVTANATSLLALATGGGNPTSYTYTQVENMKAIAVGIQSSLNSIVSAYANAIIATAAADTDSIDDAAIALLNATLSGMTSATSLKSALSSVTVPQAYTDDLTALETAQADVAGSIAQADTLLTAHATGKTNITDGTEVSSVTNGIVKPLIGGLSGMQAYDKNNEPIEISGDLASLATTVGSIYIGGGAVNTVALYTNTFKVTEAMGVSVYAGAKANTTGKLDGVKTSVNTLNPTFGAGVSNISDHYGYIIDFAFRTNASGSSLLLSEARNRVYTNTTQTDEGQTPATMGAGSTGTFDFGSMTYKQGKKLLEAFRVVFFDPANNNEILATAKFNNISAAPTDGSTTITAVLGLIETTTTEGKYTLGKDAYVFDAYKVAETVTVDGNPVQISGTTCNTYAETLDEEGYNQLDDTTAIPEGAADGKYTLGKDAYVAYYKLADTKVTVGGEDVQISDTTCNTYSTAPTAAEYAALPTATKKAADGTTDSFTGSKTIKTLQQNAVEKVSVLVYLDGDNIDNASVNAMGTSGSLKLNLQFSSTANLTPMENDDLKNMPSQTTPSTGGGENP